MSHQILTVDELRAWPHKSLDIIYTFSNDEWIEHLKVPDELKDDHKLFVIGTKLGLSIDVAHCRNQDSSHYLHH